MGVRSAVGTLLGAALLVVVALLLVGQLMGQPVLLGYVSTGSMAPTLQPGDGFVAVPPAFAGPIEEGDVVTFDARELDGGGLTTHRVVGRTEEGFITKGDANPVTDQDGSEPPVSRSRVVAVAWQVGGDVVVIPNLGVLVTGIGDLITGAQRQLAAALGTRALLGTQGLAYLLFAVGVAGYAVTAVLGAGSRERVRGAVGRSTGMANVWTVILVLALVLALVLTASMTLTGGERTFEVVSSQSDAAGIRVIPVGGTEELTYRIPNPGITPVAVYLEPASEGVSIEPRRVRLAGGEEANVSVSISVPDRTGVYDRAFVEHRYIALLPADVMDALYAIHPWAPILAIDALVCGLFALVAVAIVGTGVIRLDSRNPNVSTLDRLRRRFR